MKSEYWASRLRPKSARILAISLASILAVSALCLMNGFSQTAYASEKIDTVAGKITMTLMPSDTPTQPGTQTTDGKSGGSSSGTDGQTTTGGGDGKSSGSASGQSGTDVNANAGNQQNAGFTGTIKKVLASTGDYIPFALVSLLVAGTAFAGITFIARRSSDSKMLTVHNLSKLSTGKKIVIVACAALLMSGTAFAVKQAIADEPEDDATSLTRFARVTGDIVVNEKGEIRSAKMEIDNRCKSKITVKKIYSSGDFADIINGQVQAGDLIEPDDIQQKMWKPTAGKINPLLLAKLRKNSGTLTEEVKADLMRKVYSVKFMKDSTGTDVHEEQTVYENETATCPTNKPTKMNHYFEHFFDRANGGVTVDPYYIVTHPVTEDAVYHVSWKYYQPGRSFMLKKNSDPNHVIEFYNKKEKDEEFIPVEKVKEAADLIKKGKNPDPEKFNDQNDEWHMFTYTNDTSDQDKWIVSRIIHVGNHDGDGTGLTFQAIHGSASPYKYNETYEAGKTDTRLIDYASSTIRKWINENDIDGAFSGIRDYFATVHKKTCAAYTVRSKHDKDETNDRIWVASLPEMISDVRLKSAEWENLDWVGTAYNFWKTKNLNPMVGKGNAVITPVQARYMKELTQRRSELYAGKSAGTPRNTWLRSLSPIDATQGLTIRPDGQIESSVGKIINTDHAINVCWAF